jgi:hypothetical protein
VSRRAPKSGIRLWLASGLLAVFGSACRTGSGPDPGRFRPEARAAVRALEESLGAWRASADLERTTSTIRPVMFVDQQRQPGQRLRAFSILRESPGSESYRQYLVKLSLENPDESILATYYVFGQGPIWVYRAEDFDMIMHMDKSMMPEPPAAAGRTGPAAGSNAESAGRHEAPR